MKVYVLHLDEDTQVCSTLEKAIEAAKEAIMSWSVDSPSVDKVHTCPETEDTEIDFSYYIESIYRADVAWIYAYEVDGGPIY